MKNWSGERGLRADITLAGLVLTLGTAGLSVGLWGCSNSDGDSAGNGNSAGDGDSSDSGGNSGGSNSGSDAGVDGQCSDLRMTQYSATDRRWCGFDRTHRVLPDFVRDGLTVAIAEPFADSSYEGDVGEACGECWQIETAHGSEVVMVHDICPIEGNPVCDGSEFHFDVSHETASALDGGEWLGSGMAQRVPCPVSGNIHVYITARNQWGYAQIAFFNHRYPIRLVEYQAAGSDEWIPMERCLARWCTGDTTEAFAEGGPGVLFRLTSARGQQAVADAALDDRVSEGSDFDTGAQFDEVDEELAACSFSLPGDVYIDEYGGSAGVTWTSNTWGSAEAEETGSGCANDSASCLRLDNFADSGLHLTYRNTFARDTFETLTLSVRSDSETGEIDVSPRTEDGRCSGRTAVPVTAEWTEVTINLAEVCPAEDELHGLTVSWPTSDMDLMLDDIRFE